MPGRPVSACVTLALALAAWPAAAAEQVVLLEGTVPPGEPRHFRVPFEVPEGTREVEVRHDDLSEANILDWGLEDPEGFRGWGGGNPEPAILNGAAASRSYLPGAIQSGTWRVVIGKAKVVELPARYRVEVVLRDTVTLPPTPGRRPYREPAPLSVGPRWYAGDFHVHSRESGDARPPLDEIASFARSRGLDFVAISDHNVLTQLDFMGHAQDSSPDVLLLPAMEWTTYAGHGNALGLTRWFDAAVGQPGITAEGQIRAMRESGALFSINHPALDLGDVCIGCAWRHSVPGELIDAVEIATGGLRQGGLLFTPRAIAFWDALAAQGHHAAAIGGSDDHRAGVDLGNFQSPIGSPTTLVFADELSVAGILQGVREGRTVVKLQDPTDPMLEVKASREPRRSLIRAARATLTFRVTAPSGDCVLKIVKNGEPLLELGVESDPFLHALEVESPATGEDRYRGEVWVDGTIRTVTSHLFVSAPAPDDAGAPGAGAGGTPGAGGGCGCRVPPAGTAVAGLGLAPALLALGASLGRRRASAHRS